MAQLQDLKVKISLDNSQFQSGINNIEKQTSSLGASMRNLVELLPGLLLVKQFLTLVRKLLLLGWNIML